MEHSTYFIIVIYEYLLRIVNSSVLKIEKPRNYHQQHEGVEPKEKWTAAAGTARLVNFELSV